MGGIYTKRGSLPAKLAGHDAWYIDALGHIAVLDENGDTWSPYLTLGSGAAQAAPGNHTHPGPDMSGYALVSHTHTPASLGAAAAGHTHTAAEVGAAAAGHTHPPGDAATLGGLPAGAFAAAGHSHAALPVAMALAANAVTSNVAATPTNLAVPMAANESWLVEAHLVVQKATTATGMKTAVGAPAGATVEGFSLGGLATANSAPVQNRINAINTLGATYATGIAIPVSLSMIFRITNGPTPGNCVIQFATVTSNPATIFAGSSLLASRVTLV